MSGTKIDRARIEHVAKLASLTLTDAEAASLTEDITKILEQVDALQQIDTTGIDVAPHLLASDANSANSANSASEPSHASELARSAWREDIVAPSLSNADAVSQSARTSGEPGEAGFAVPVFVES